MAALDYAPDGPAVEIEREQLRRQARAMDMRLVSFTITEEPIHDPALEALPAADRKRIAAVSRGMHIRPQRYLAELKRLAARYPHIPMIQNHLAGALNAAGKRKQAARVLADTAQRFPTYVFGFCNHIMKLIATGQIEAARLLVETGPRGPVFTLVDFDPTRDTFHISEAVSYAAMVGFYMLATDRYEAAKVQLEMLYQSAPDSLQCHSLATAMGTGEP